MVDVRWIFCGFLVGFRMASSRKNAGAEGADADEIELIEDADLMRVLQELDNPDDITWRVTRIWPATPGERGFLDTLTSTELTLQYMRDTYGAGKYHLKGMRSDGTFAKHATVHIARTRNTENKQPAQDQGQKPPAQMGMFEFMTMMRESEARSSELMLRWGAIIAPIAGPLLTALITRPPPQLPPMPTMNDFASMAANLKELLKDDKRTPDNTEQLIKLLGVLKDYGPGGEKGGEGSNWLDFGRDVLDTLKPGLQGLAARLATERKERTQQPTQQRLPPALQVPPAAAPTQPPSPATTGAQPAATPEGGDMLQLLNWLKGTLRNLIRQAAANKDPSLYAEVALDNVPQGTDPAKLLEYLNRDDWWEVLSAFVPDVAPYKGWFTEFRDECIKGLRHAIARQAAESDVVAKEDGDGSTPDGM